MIPVHLILQTVLIHNNTCDLLTVTVLAQVAIPRPDDMVMCYSTDDCTRDAVNGGQLVTRVACCDNQIAPVGYSTQIGTEGCQRCPIG